MACLTGAQHTEIDPLNVIVGVDTATAHTGDGGEKQAFAFVQAQCVHAQLGLCSHLPDAQPIGGRPMLGSLTDVDLDRGLGRTVANMTMRYTPLGGTGIRVSRYCLGTMMFGSIGNAEHENCARILHAALDHGINFVDTADRYSAGESETIVGKALRGRREEVVLATKGTSRWGTAPTAAAAHGAG